MSFSYTPGATTDLNRVRLLVGDTDSTDPQLQDEEIIDILLTEGNRYYAAAVCAETIGAHYARQVDYQAKGAIAEQISQLQKHYADLAVRLRRTGARMGITPYAGGISESDKDTRNEDTDRVPPVFAREMETEPGTELPPPDQPIAYPLA